MIHERIYLDDTDERVYIDTYVANDRTKKRDAVIVIPGGGYHWICTEREGEPIALAYLAEGTNAFVLNYRVSDDGNDRFPKQLVDVGRAILYLKKNCERYSINPERIFTLGFSAGGHIAGTSAIMYDAPEVRETLGISSDENKPCGAILCYPVVTANTDITHKPSFMNLLGKPFEDITDEERKRFSLETAINENSAPLFIWHTVEDTLVPVNGTLRLAEAAKNCGVPFALHVYPYGPHGFALANSVTSGGKAELESEFAAEWVKTSIKWMKTV